MTTTQADDYRQGLWHAMAAYALWGLFPLFWYPLDGSPIPADQILAQRVVWSMVLALLLLMLTQRTRTVLGTLANPHLLWPFVLGSLLISVNWLGYIWAVVNDHVLDASLGYFISPLVNIVLGRLFFGERLNRMQWLAAILAGIGILWLAIPAGRVPWVAITLALSFGLYSAVRKRTTLDALSALSVETLLILPFAIAWLLFCQSRGTLVFGDLGALQQAVLICSGIATIVPLLFYSGAVRRIPLSLLGMLQYGAPTLQLLLGLVVFGESFSPQRFIGYVWVWAGVACFLLGLWRQGRQRPAHGPP